MGQQLLTLMPDVARGTLLSDTLHSGVTENNWPPPQGLWSGRENKKEKWDDKKRVENREGSLGYPGFEKKKPSWFSKLLDE
ncbi:hypothetical protein TNCV_1568111 [Trichonephila clavipes]|nr:hypothetical protein TNCV_1568111 [Trichonephila clavipes]